MSYIYDGSRTHVDTLKSYNARREKDMNIKRGKGVHNEKHFRSI
jgi:hypothetical protein